MRLSKAVIWRSLLFAGLLLTVGGAPAASAATLKVVTTTTALASIARWVGGEKVTVSSIATGYQDPHFIEPKPSYMTMARAANLWIRVGLELEAGWEEAIIDGSRNRKIRVGTLGHVDVSDGVTPLEVPTGKADRSLGDIHPYGNPHYWLDPFNGKIIAWNIANRLSQLSPDDKDYFWARYASFRDALDRAMFGSALVDKLLDAGIKMNDVWYWQKTGQLYPWLKERKWDGLIAGWYGLMLQHEGKSIVTYHRSWSYLSSRFRFQVAAELEPKPGIPPSPKHVGEVTSLMQKQRIRVLLMEPFYALDYPNLVAQQTGATVVVAANSVGGTQAARDYISMIDAVLRAVAAGL